MSRSTTTPGPSSMVRSTWGPVAQVVAKRSKYVTSRAGRRGARRTSVPFIHATGSIAICVIPSGIPSSSARSSRRESIAVVHADPRPRARRATQKQDFWYCWQMVCATYDYHGSEANNMGECCGLEFETSHEGGAPASARARSSAATRCARCTRARASTRGTGSTRTRRASRATRSRPRRTRRARRSSAATGRARAGPSSTT